MLNPSYRSNKNYNSIHWHLFSSIDGFTMNVIVLLAYSVVSHISKNTPRNILDFSMMLRLKAEIMCQQPFP